MKLALVGLGKMGLNMAGRLRAGGHELVVHDLSAAAVSAAVAEGARAAETHDALLAALPDPRVVWLMLPAGEVTENAVYGFLAKLKPGDVLIDGGNSNYKDSMRRGADAAKKGIHFVDAGTSGGVWGRENGYSMMVGGEPSAIDRIRPVLETLAPAADRGWGHVGPAGAGHFVKMVHNGIEYGMMQAMAEGFAILEKKSEFRLDLRRIARIWQHGSVVRSWLLDLTERALSENPGLAGVAPQVSDSGEGRWTAAEAVELDVAAPVITLSLLERIRSRERNSFSDRLLAMMRNQFGGHSVSRK